MFRQLIHKISGAYAEPQTLGHTMSAGIPPAVLNTIKFVILLHPAESINAHVRFPSTRFHDKFFEATRVHFLLPAFV